MATSRVVISTTTDEGADEDVAEEETDIADSVDESSDPRPNQASTYFDFFGLPRGFAT